MATLGDYTPAEDSFQVTLPSTACTDLFVHNRANSYRIQLMKPIECSPPNQWEFALVDIQFPHNWPNVLETTYLGFFVEILPDMRRSQKMPPDLLGTAEAAASAVAAGTLAINEEFEITLREAWYKDTYFDQDWTFATHMCIPKGHYKSIEELGEFIQRSFARAMQPLIAKCGYAPGLWFQYDRITGIARFRTEDGFKVHFVTNSIYIMETLFFFPRTHTTTSMYEGSALTQPPAHSYLLPLTSKHEAELEHLSSLYVYSDIAQHHLIGNTSAQILSIVPIDSMENENHERGKQQFYTVNPPYYMPVPKPIIDSVNIEIRTDFATLFPFAETGNSKVRCRLHFRKRDCPTNRFLL